jgi:hypothetical protein
MNKSSNGCFPKLSHLTAVVEARAFSARKSSDDNTLHAEMD